MRRAPIVLAILAIAGGTILATGLIGRTPPPSRDPRAADRAGSR